MEQIIIPDHARTKYNCYHCGNDCKDSVLQLEDKHFCCDGCQTVYEILHENDMEFYYNLEKNPGKQQLRDGDHADKYAFLDNETIKSELLDFYEDGMGRMTFTIPQIHCSSCIWLLENLQRLNKGVKNSMVNFAKKEASVTFNDREISLRRVVELLTAIGYEPAISLASAKKDAPQAKTDRSLYYKIGVAGFCFGNAMLLSFPDYLAPTRESVEDYQQIFNYINFALALPIVFYCSIDYFIAAYKNLKHKVISIDVPLALGIVVIFGWSCYEVFTHIGTGYFDSLAGLLFFLLTGRWYQQKTYEMLSFERDYKSYFPIAVTRIHTHDNGSRTEESIPVRELVMGDIIKIRSREIVPADAELLDGEANIDYSFVTGEANAIAKAIGDRIYAGGRQMGGMLTLKVLKPVSQSYLTQLWNQQAFHKESQLHLTSIINRTSTIFTITILVISLLTGIYWAFADMDKLALAVTSVLIVACPCALALSLPYAFGSTLRVFGRQGFYLKNTEVVENLTKIDTIVFDKTGTLSHNKAAKIEFVGALTPEICDFVKSITAHSTHPLSQMLNAGEQLRTAQIFDILNFREVENKGMEGIINGKMVRVGSASWVNAPKPEQAMASYVFVSVDDEVCGYFLIQKKYRQGLDTLLQTLRQRYDVYLLSGDNDSERDQLSPLFADDQHLLFNQSPMDKLNFIQSLQQRGKTVLMVGDGLNDAGALQQSNVGIAVAEDINSFSPASDAILDARQFEQLPQFIAFSQTSLRILRTSFLLSLSYNVVGVSFAVRGLLTPLLAAILMPLSSVTVVGFVTIATMWQGKRLLNLLK